MNLAFQSRHSARALVALGAVVAATLVWTITIAVFGIDVTVPESPGSDTRSDLGLGPVVITAALASLAGWGLLALLERFTAKAITIWTIVALVVLVLSMPYMPGFSAAERIVLGLLHLAVGAVLIVGMRQTSQTAR